MALKPSPGPTQAGTNQSSQQAGHDPQKQGDDAEEKARVLKEEQEAEERYRESLKKGEHDPHAGKKEVDAAAPAVDPNVNVQIKNNGQNVIGLYNVGVNPDGTIQRALMQKLKKGEQLVLNDNVRAMEVRLEPAEG